MNPDFTRRIANHLKGASKLGMFALRDDGRVKWAAVQFDWHSVSGAWDEAVAYHESLLTFGIRSYIERIDTGLDTDEFKVWIFFEEPIDVRRVVSAIRASIAKADLGDHIPSIPGGPEVLGGDAQFAWLPYFGGATTSTFVNRAMRRTGDVKKFVESLRTVSMDEFKKLEMAMLPFTEQMQDQRANFIGSAEGFGEVVRNCPFLKWCDENADEGIPSPLMSALMTNLVRFGAAGNRKLIEIGRRGVGEFNEAAFARRLAAMIGVDAPVTYGAIKLLGWPGTIPAWPESPAGWGIHLDLDLVARTIGALSPHEQANALREHFRLDFNHIPPEKQQPWLDRLHAEIGVSFEDLMMLARSAFDVSEFTGWSLKSVLGAAEGHDFDPEQKGSAMYRWLAGNGGISYLDDAGKCIAAWKDSQMEIGTNADFKAFLYRETGLTFKSPKVSRIVEAFKSEALLHAVRVSQVSWLRTNRAASTIYIHVNASDRKIFRISPDKVVQIDNGANDDRVLLLPSPKMSQFDFRKLSKPEYEKALRDLDETVFQNMACSRENQLLCACWALAYPLLDYAGSKPHLRCEGSSAKGKSRGLELIASTIYGTKQLDKISEAASYAVGAQNPAIFIDQIETGDMTQAFKQFILTAVSGIQKVKRKPGTVSGVISEPVRCINATSGIDNLQLPELINRTFHVEFDSQKYGKPLYIATDIDQAILKIRSAAISAHLQLISKVLRRLNANESQIWHAKINADHQNHNTIRLNEYYALMALIAEEFVPVIDPRRDVKQLVDAWIDYQNEYGTITAVQSNQLVAIVESIFDEADKQKISSKPPKWQYDIPCDGRTLHGNANKLLQAFTKASTRHRLKLDYRSENTLSRRLKDAAPLMAKAGFVLTAVKDGHLKHDVFTITRHDLTTSTSVSAKPRGKK
ncbi:MAG: hypothetical protein H6508_01740 [Calditrichaeota bacterium]|nr:hypothetical protein [Calditrichota bacterium]